MKVAVVTGASEGFGLSIANKLVEESWEVVNLSRKACPNSEVYSISTDLTNEVSVISAVSEILGKYSEVDLLVNNAGVLRIEELGEINYTESANLLMLNLLAPLFLISKLKEAIVKCDGDIINIGSTSGYKGRTNWGIYGASKWGVRGLHENLKEEFHDTKVRVTLFNPPAFKSNHFEKAGIKIDDMSEFLDPNDLANMVFNIVNAPKSIQVGEVIVNKKPLN